ncbi:MAG TPA: hypothetical protein VGH33_09020 [Isosphaeraceae bacterium]|jgi:hypothetical protein
MPTFHEPEDVDFVVNSGPCSPEMARATGEWIKAYKRRADQRERAKTAGPVLAPRGPESGSGEESDADAILEYWGRVIEDLDRAERGGSDG